MEVATGSTNNDVPGGGKKVDEQQSPQEEDSKPPAIDTSAAAAAGTSASGGALGIMSSRSTGTVDASDRALLSTSLIRMTDGLPRRELKLIIDEAEQCEKALQEEIDMLNKALEVERRKTKKKKNTTTEATPSTKGGEDKKGQKEDDDDVKMDDKTEAAINTMVESEITPPDQFWTLSALLGRLRHDLTTPLPPQSQIPFTREQNGLGPLEAQLARKIPPYLKKKRGSLLNQQTTFATSTGTASAAGGSGSVTTTPAGSGRSTPVSGAVGGGGNNTTSSSVEISQFQRLIDIEDHPVYTREHKNPDQLISLWKKISMHKSSLVFRKPVNPKEAPGYTDRIMFPMDLSVMRKLIFARTMKSYKDFSQRVALISHNCVKYNGRESDYALVAREFESVCSEFIWIAVQDEIAEGATAAGFSSAAISAPAAAAAAAAATLATKSTSTENTASMEKKVSTSEKPPPSSSAAAAAATTATAGGGSSGKDTATDDGTDNTDKKRKHDEVVAAGTDDKDQEKEPPAKEAKKASD